MSTFVNGFERLKAEYELCPDFHEIYVKLKDGTTEKLMDLLHDGYLYLGCKLCIPRTSIREFFVWELHAYGLPGHFGNEKTIKTVEYRFYWPSLKSDVGMYVDRCHIYQLVK